MLQRDQHVTNMQSWSSQDDSRWRDNADATRAGVALFDLLAQHNELNNRLGEAVRQSPPGKPIGEIEERLVPSPLDRINRILELSGLPVQIRLTDKASFDAEREGIEDRYPISEMSDGEKSAVLLAAEVLTAPSGCVQILDEPERHLHRSISVALIEAVLNERPDCHFVVLTHDLDLAGALPGSLTTSIVLARSGWTSKTPAGWDMDLVESTAEFPEGIKAAVLGGRRRVLFIEGERTSRDYRLYRLLFPEWSVVPAGGCDEVIRAVKGLSESVEYHWLHCRGVVDGDSRSPSEADALRAAGILALRVHEVESVYYCEILMRAVAAAQEKNLERAPDELFDLAVEAGLNELGSGDTVDRLAAVVAVAALRRQVLESLPDHNSIATEPARVEIAVDSPFPTEVKRIRELLGSRSLEEIVQTYPIRDCGLRGEIAKRLGFQNAENYEAFARSLITADPVLAQAVRGLVGELPP